MSESLCPQNKIIFDAERGEYICTETGEVIEDRVIDQGPEWREYDAQQSIARARAEKITLNRHDFGLGSYVSRHQRLLRLHGKRLSTHDKKIITLLSITNDLAAKLQLPKHIVDTTSLILRNVSNYKLSGVRLKSLAIAGLYYACKVHNEPVLLDRINKYIRIEDRQNSEKRKKWWKALRIVSSIASSNNIKPRMTWLDFVKAAQEKINLPQNVINYALELLVKIYEKGRLSKSPLAYVGGATYIAAAILDYKVTQQTIAKALGITEVSLRNGKNEILKTLGDIEYSCKSCGNVIYRYGVHKVWRFDRKKHLQDYFGLRSISEIKIMTNGICPYCGKPLQEMEVRWRKTSLAGRE